jgi:pyruvate formate lyase activating enzyme
MIGRIHSLESLSTVDGPGIRYVVFMQGCMLRCKFCHNPDTWSIKAGIQMTSDELLKKILASKKFMDKSNGGVTISGGEPLLQIDFLIEFCKKLKENNIHVAIDTAGNFDTEDEKINELFKYVDLVLFDIKHMDNEIHKFLTGAENIKILNMAKYISNEKKIPMWIRIVYIPNITDKNDTINKYKEFISKLRSVEKVEILPYHEMGKYKWKELGIKYELENIRIPTNEECKKLSKFIFQK